MKQEEKNTQTKKQEEKNTQTKKGFKVIKTPFHIYGARESKSGKYVNISLCFDNDDGSRTWATAIIKAENACKGKDKDALYIKCKHLELKAEKSEVEDDTQLPF